MRIAVVGSGYVGLVTGACFADLGHDVLLVDNDEEKLSSLREGEVPIHERFLPELLARHREQRIKFSSVEGFVPPAAVELATTATASTHTRKPRPGAEPVVEPESTPPND